MKKCPSHMFKDFWTPAALRIIVLNLYLILKLATFISDQRGACQPFPITAVCLRKHILLLRNLALPVHVYPPVHTWGWEQADSDIVKTFILYGFIKRSAFRWSNSPHDLFVFTAFLQAPCLGKPLFSRQMSRQRGPFQSLREHRLPAGARGRASGCAGASWWGKAAVKHIQCRNKRGFPGEVDIDHWNKLLRGRRVCYRANFSLSLDCFSGRCVIVMCRLLCSSQR